ncbi:MAG: RDD family protein [Aureliella sp.]
MRQLQVNDEDKLDCSTRVITPENIAFEYALAGPFQRLPAFLFDIGVRVAFFIAMVFVLSAVLPFLPFGFALVNIGILIGFFVLSWFYGVFFESRFNGRTLGKMVFKLRTISIDGRPINASQAALRNILRLADMNVLLSMQIFGSEAPPMFLFPTMLVGFVTMMMTRRMQRIGDIAAGTMVVAEGRRTTPWNLQPEDLRAFGLAELIPLNYQPSSSLAQTIGLYMENRRRLNPLRRNDVAKHLAFPLIKRFGLLPDTSPDLLLCALYVRTFMPQEQQAEGRERMRVLQSRRSGPLPTVGTTLNQAQVAKPVLPAVGAAVVDSAPADVVPGTLSESPKENRDETPST